MTDDHGTTITATCGSCGIVIVEDPSTPAVQRQPCPSCGAMNRLVKVHLVATIKFRTSLRLKGREPGRTEPFLEAKTGDDLFRRTGEWNQVEQVVDRRSNRYRKRVVDPRTGQVLRNVDEPLTKHRGRGSAKYSKKQKKS